MAKATLNEIIAAYGSYIDAKVGGGGAGLAWVEGTNYANHSELSGHEAKQIASTMQAFNFNVAGGQVTNLPPLETAVINLTNSTGVSQTTTYSDTQTTTQTYNWSVTEAVSVGITISTKETIPEVAEVGESLTSTISVSDTTGSTYTNARTWAVNEPVVVAPNSTTKAQMVISQQSYNIPWSSSVLLSGAGCAAIWFNNFVDVSGKNEMHHLNFFPLNLIFATILENLSDVNFAGLDLSGFHVDAATGDVHALCSGMFTGSQGTVLNVTYS